ncbi:MAG: histidine kinase [Bacteroidetes bacterium]|nr:histidine kinase [Bacteroidota bacterium]MBK8487893.1 histidine kinase [Bacteroidota bacterium]MBK8682353.1 histidine kinase [Bacteroidota bacterium]MBP9188199.1 histidine kinase [Chitinophagales bacterium]MBP9704425.1 histidine kinase [Chitinophagales bacterium]
MENNGGLIFVILVLIAVSIWLYKKYKVEQKQRDKLSKENTKLTSDMAILEVEHLKFQLQPHTLRNMVSTLNVAAKNLYKGSESLAETLDYILYQGNQHLVSIQDELNFLEKYKALQGNFVYQIDSIIIDKSEVNTNSKYFTTACVPHLITAYFVENAFKHGDRNHPEFLKITLKLSKTTFELNVINKIIPNRKETQGGIGLSNMKKRLERLLKDKFELRNSCNELEYYSTLIIRF